MKTNIKYRRSNVIKAASFYLISSWLLMQIYSVVAPYFHLPVFVGTGLVIALVCLFPVICCAAYFFEWLDGGFVRISRLNISESPTFPQVERRKALLTNFSPDLQAIHEAIKKIAIMPFRNLVEDTSSQFLGFALADQIIGSMAYSRHVLVRPSSCIREYQTKEYDIQEVGKKLRVNYLLAGNFIKAESKIKLNVELVELALEKIIWKDSIVVEYEDIFELQDLVAQKIAENLKIQFSEIENLMMQAEQPADRDAYEMYLRALSQPVTLKGHEQAITLIEAALKLDPNYASLHLELGCRLFSVAQVGHDTADAHSRAEQALLKALALNPDSLPALANLGMLYTDSGQHVEAHGMLIKALRINPSDAWLHFALSYHYRYIGFLEESKVEMEIAIAIDAYNPMFRSSVVTYMFLGEYDHVLEHFELAKDTPFTLNYLGEVAFRAGRLELAASYFEKVADIEHEIGEFYFAASFLEYLKGNVDEAIEFNRKREAENPADSEIFYEIARIYGLYGAESDCCRTLKIAIEMGYVSYPSMVADVFLDPVRGADQIKPLLLMAQEKHFKLKVELTESYH